MNASHRDDAHVDPGRIVEWLESSLPDSESAAIAEHVERCGRCRSEVVLARRFVEGVDSRREHERMRTEFDVRLGGPSRSRRRSPAPRRVLALAALAAALVFAGIGLDRMRPNTGPPDPSGRVRGVVDEARWTLEAVPLARGWRVSWSCTVALEEVEFEILGSDGTRKLRRLAGAPDFQLEPGSNGTPGVGELLRLRGFDENGNEVVSPLISLP